VATVPAEYYGDDPTMYKVALLKNTEGYSPDGLFRWTARKTSSKC